MKKKMSWLMVLMMSLGPVSLTKASEVDFSPPFSALACETAEDHSQQFHISLFDYRTSGASGAAVIYLGDKMFGGGWIWSENWMNTRVIQKYLLHVESIRENTGDKIVFSISYKPYGTLSEGFLNVGGEKPLKVKCKVVD